MWWASSSNVQPSLDFLQADPDQFRRENKNEYQAHSGSGVSRLVIIRNIGDCAAVCLLLCLQQTGPAQQTNNIYTQDL